jgi:hypothetical protein
MTRIGNKHRYAMGKLSRELQYDHARKDKRICSLVSGHTLLNGLGPPIPRSWYSGQSVEQDSEVSIFSVHLSEKDVKRLDLVKTFLERSEFICNDNFDKYDGASPRFRDMYIGKHLSNFSNDCWGYPMAIKATNFRSAVISPFRIRI